MIRLAGWLSERVPSPCCGISSLARNLSARGTRRNGFRFCRPVLAFFFIILSGDGGDCCVQRGKSRQTGPASSGFFSRLPAFCWLGCAVRRALNVYVRACVGFAQVVPVPARRRRSLNYRHARVSRKKCDAAAGFAGRRHRRRRLRSLAHTRTHTAPAAAGGFSSSATLLPLYAAVSPWRWGTRRWWEGDAIVAPSGDRSLSFSFRGTYLRGWRFT